MSRPVRLQPMTGERFEAWAAHSVAGFAAAQVASGLLPAAEAGAHARRAFAELLPHRLATPLHHFWTVWADGDEVGHLWLRVRTLSTEVEGYVYDVELVTAARGRGLGRATMLAAEDAARGLGATVMRLNVFGHNLPALRLYDGLGYAVGSATLSRRTDEEPRPAASTDVELREMAPALFGPFRERVAATLSEDIVRARVLPMEEARRKVAGDVDLLLGDGGHSPGQLVWTAHRGSVEVADVWVDVQNRSDGRHADVRWLEVPSDRRRARHGRLVAEAVLAECGRRGIRSVGVTVPGWQTPALRLCEQLGFRLTAHTMVKPLGSPAG